MPKRTIIICEKPSVARDYMKVLNVSAGNTKGYVENDQWIITWSVGHLVTMSYPEKYDPKYKSWNLEDLPFLPDTYKYEVIADVSEQFEIVKKLYHRPDVSTLMFAGDAGREGLYIQVLIRQLAGLAPGIEEKVVWLDSQTEDEIRRGIREAKPVSAYEGLKNAGYLRAIEDYALGINFSRAYSVCYAPSLNEKAGTKKYTSINVGRVMTCVLGMVVFREREITGFVPTDFYKPVCTVNVNGTELTGRWKVTPDSAYEGHPHLYEDVGFRQEQDAKDMIANLPGQVTIKECSVKEEKKSAPTLYNLTELQAECSKTLKISPDETLNIAQSLYEKKLTTYPRTDARVLTTAIAKEIKTNLEGLADYCEFEPFVQMILADGSDKAIGSQKRYTDDTKVTDHYALIPTGSSDGFEELTELEKEVYFKIVRRFLAIFLPPAVYQKGKVIFLAGKEQFEATGKVMIAPGYLFLYGDSDSGEEDTIQAMQSLSTGQCMNASYTITKGQTKPPSRYTSGSLVLAMENAGNLIEEEELRAQIKGSGIGTTATRAETIKKLCDLHYIQLNKKTQVVTPDTLGEHVCALVEEITPSLLNPKMTASWEKGLEMVKDQKISPNEYLTKIYDYIRKETAKIKTEESKLYQKGFQKSPLEKQELSLLCPLCNQPLFETEKFYGCSSYKGKKDAGCGFIIAKNIAGYQIEQADLEELLSANILKNRTFKAKNGKEFSADLALKTEDGSCKTEFIFEGQENEVLEDSNVVCPKCKKNNMKKGTYFYKCSCGFHVPHTIASRSLSEEEMKELLSKKKIGPLDGFISKTGKMFSTSLKYRAGKISFDFK